MNVVDWLRESANYMVEQYPDIYEYSTALGDLIHYMENLRGSNQDVSGFMSGPFMMIRMTDGEGMEEFRLTHFVSSVTTFQPEEECFVFGNRHLGVNLPDSLDDEVDNDEDL